MIALSYNRIKMEKLLEVDRFLRDTFHELNGELNNEEEALRILFDTYIMNEPIFQNAYFHLT